MKALSYLRSILVAGGFLGAVSVLSIMITIIGNLPNIVLVNLSDAVRFTFGFGLMGIAVWAVLILPSKNPLKVDLLGKITGWVELVLGLILAVGSFFM